MKLTIKKGSENYCCTVVKINKVFDIKDADNIKRVNVLGNDVVVSKDVKDGDIMLYFVSGTKLDYQFCSYNNLFTDNTLNIDTTKKGYISPKNCRVKAVKLRGCISDGILLPITSLNYIKNLGLFSIGDNFTDINGVPICEKYIVVSTVKSNNKLRSVKKFKKLIDNQFSFHNDTADLRRNIHKLNPDNIIGIHYKKHGTSVVIGNLLTNRRLSWFEKLLKRLGININDREYDIIYSSRKVVKSELNAEHSYYNEDIWGVVSKEVSHLIPKNWTLYGEILGYLPTGKAIQSMKNVAFDYGCNIGEHKFYVYKISIVNPDGKVIYLTDKQIQEWCDKVGLLYSDTFIYYDKAINFSGDALLNEISREVANDELKKQGRPLIEFNVEKWRELFLQDLENKYNEKDCYMCTNKVPEEGIVLRIESLDEYEAYKLKSRRFILGESDDQENEVLNIEDQVCENDLKLA